MARISQSPEEFAKEIEEILKDPPKFEGLTAEDVLKLRDEPVLSPQDRYRIAHGESKESVIAGHKLIGKLFRAYEESKAETAKRK